MRYEDLPAAARAQVDAKLGRKPRRKVSRKEAAGEDGPYRCHKCKQEFPSFGRKGGAEEHARETGHVRQEMILPCLS